MDEEIWRPVCPPFSEFYEVSNRGRVRATHSGRILRAWRGTLAGGVTGYFKVLLSNRGVSGTRIVRMMSVHRLVAFAFVPGDHTLDVNHKDCDKANNRAENLEWVTHAENIRHGMAANFEWRDRLRLAGRKRQMPVIATAEDGSETRYDSFAHAARALGDVKRAANIWNALQLGARAYGFTWRLA